MDMSILYMILVIAGILVGLALVWLLVEVVMTVRKARKKVNEIHEQLTPTIANIEQITAKIQPVLEKADPLVERITLTVDAANLELMRADQILENVNTITEGVASATTAVGNIANAPADLVSKASKKIQSVITGDKSFNVLESAVAGNLEEGDFSDDISKIASGAKKKGKLFGKRVKNSAKKAQKKMKQDSRAEDDMSQFDPYISIS